MSTYSFPQRRLAKRKSTGEYVIQYRIVTRTYRIEKWWKFWHEVGTDTYGEWKDYPTAEIE